MQRLSFLVLVLTLVALVVAGGTNRSVASAAPPPDVNGPQSNTPQGQAIAALQARTQGTASLSFDADDPTIVAAVYANGIALSAPQQGTTGDIARSFLRDNAGIFGVDASFVKNLVETTTYTTGNGLRVTELTQFAGQYEVFRGQMKVGMAANGMVVSAANGLRPGLQLNSTTPRLTEATARRAAESYLGLIISTPGRNNPAPSQSTGTPAKLWAVPAAKELRLAYGFQIQAPNSPSLWYIIIDAHTLAPLYQKNLTDEAGPEGQVFTQHPTVPCNAGTLPCGQTAPIPFTTASASPYSLDATHTQWVTADSTQGNNVIARDSSATVGNTPTGPVTTVAGATFNFPFQNSYELLAGAISAQDINGSVTNLFYQNNYMHDWMYSLGFTEAARNFQENNFGLGGVGNDSVNAGALFARSSCAGCRNNAFFSTPPDGGDGVMQMYVFDSPFPDRDGSLDGDVIVHEYGHGVSNRLIGNAFGLNFGEGAAMGEGWSDYWAATRYNDPVMGDYVTGNTVRGVRNFAYNVHPWTYGHLCTGFCEEHNDGEIWAATLWDLRTTFRTLLGAGPGTLAVDQLVFNGIATTPTDPSMLQARDAILAAETAAPHVGVNICDLWTVFAARGMGFSATTTGTSATEKFDKAPACYAGIVGITPETTSIRVDERGALATFIVERTGDLSTPLTLNALSHTGTADAFDFTGISVPVTFTAGKTRAGVTIPIKDDSSFEGSEFFTVTLSGSPADVLLTSATATITIIDNEPPSYPGAPVPIPDNNPAGATASFLASGVTSSITDLNVVLDIPHTYVGDLVVTLESPDHTIVTIVNRPGSNNCRGDAIFGLFDDSAPTAQSACSNTTGLSNGPYIPASPLSAFNGKNANGTWTLKAVDHVNSDAGSIRGFALFMSPPSTPANGTIEIGTFVSSVPENVGSVVVPLTRTGGSIGEVTVYCATTDAAGTATGVSDFTNIFGAVTWGDGDSADKACPPIPIIDDSVSEPPETFAVRVINEIGATMSSIPNSLDIIILANDAPASDMSLTKTVISPVGKVLLGGVVTYDIVITNNGPNPAIAPVMTDTLPFLNGLLIDVHGTPWACPAPISVVLTCQRSGSMASGASETITVKLTVPPAATPGTNIANTASVATPYQLPDPIPLNNSATATKSIRALDPQAINFPAIPQPKHPGDVFTAVATSSIVPNSGNPVTFTASGQCTSTGPNGATITITAGGNCTITANQAGTLGVYAAAPPVSQTLAVTVVLGTFTGTATVKVVVNGVTTTFTRPISVLVELGTAGGPIRRILIQNAGGQQGDSRADTILNWTLTTLGSDSAQFNLPSASAASGQMFLGGGWRNFNASSKIRTTLLNARTKLQLDITGTAPATNAAAPVAAITVTGTLNRVP
ncbi:hypothetical protein AYO38_03515 [bacterium SCGC AG-212-C10]|nr:hypothetical protein AYO38_03515 [bacterium SCGC AG-212-C10]